MNKLSVSKDEFPMPFVHEELFVMTLRLPTGLPSTTTEQTGSKEVVRLFKSFVNWGVIIFYCPGWLFFHLLMSFFVLPLADAHFFFLCLNLNLFLSFLSCWRKKTLNMNLFFSGNYSTAGVRGTKTWNIFHDDLWLCKTFSLTIIKTFN